MKIEPIYVIFEQAKLLKEKGFDCPCRSKFLRGEAISSSIHNPFFCELLEDIIEMPEQWQVIEWLRVVHGIWIKIDLDETTNTDTTLRYHYECIKIETDFRWSKAKVFDTPQEAYSAAFDYTLNNLI